MNGGLDDGRDERAAGWRVGESCDKHFESAKVEGSRGKWVFGEAPLSGDSEMAEIEAGDDVISSSERGLCFAQPDGSAESLLLRNDHEKPRSWTSRLKCAGVVVDTP